MKNEATNKIESAIAEVLKNRAFGSRVDTDTGLYKELTEAVRKAASGEAEVPVENPVEDARLSALIESAKSALSAGGGGEFLGQTETRSARGQFVKSLSLSVNNPESSWSDFVRRVRLNGSGYYQVVSGNEDETGFIARLEGNDGSQVHVAFRKALKKSVDTRPTLEKMQPAPVWQPKPEEYGAQFNEAAILKSLQTYGATQTGAPRKIARRNLHYYQVRNDALVESVTKSLVSDYDGSEGVRLERIDRIEGGGRSLTFMHSGSGTGITVFLRPEQEVDLLNKSASAHRTIDAELSRIGGKLHQQAGNDAIYVHQEPREAAHHLSTLLKSDPGLWRGINVEPSVTSFTVRAFDKVSKSLHTWQFCSDWSIR